MDVQNCKVLNILFVGASFSDPKNCFFLNKAPDFVPLLLCF